MDKLSLCTSLILILFPRHLTPVTISDEACNAISNGAEALEVITAEEHVIYGMAQSIISLMRSNDDLD